MLTPRAFTNIALFSLPMDSDRVLTVWSYFLFSLDHLWVSLVSVLIRIANICQVIINLECITLVVLDKSRLAIPGLGWYLWSLLLISQLGLVLPSWTHMLQVLWQRAVCLIDISHSRGVRQRILLLYSCWFLFLSLSFIKHRLLKHPMPCLIYLHQTLWTDQLVCHVNICVAHLKGRRHDLAQRWSSNLLVWVWIWILPVRQF